MSLTPTSIAAVAVPRGARALLALSVAAVIGGCPQGQAADNKNAGPPPPAGGTCDSHAECPEGQLCVESACRYGETSRAGEILATAAKAQLDQGDLGAAVETYGEAVKTYETAEAPVPPQVLCGAATAALRSATSPDERERAARRADTCLRNSLPSAPSRTLVLEALTQLRYEGLELSHFDEKKPAGRFFTNEPERPSTDAVQIALDLPDAEERGFDKIAEALRSADASRGIADCFIADWERSHERQVKGSLVLNMEAKLRDMGTYDIYEPTLEVKAAGEEGGSGFEGCVAGKLTEVLSEAGPRNAGGRVQWKQPFEVAARVQ